MLTVALLFSVVLGFVASSFDFRAFYCAGAIVQQGGNPYAGEPLHSCERALPNDPFAPYSKSTALPVPLPGYVIALFVPMARLPFTIAARIWTLLLYAAIILAVMCAVSLTGFPLTVVVSAFLLSLCAASIGLGESVPLCVAAVCFAALLARNGRWLEASLAAAASLIEPHVGLPVVLALALWVPASRLPLALALGTLALLSIGILGPGANVDYFVHVLPAHALSELGSDAQLSLSVILNGVGAGPRTAIALGMVAYLLACVGGIGLGRLLAQKFDSNAFLVATPAAFSVMGGTFIHVTQIVVALPLVMLLLTATPRYRTLFLVALLLLSVPWRVVGSPLLIAVASSVVLYLAWEISSRNWRVALFSSASALVLMLILNVWMAAPPMQKHQGNIYGASISTRYAEASWARYNEEYLSTGTPERWWRRVPTWLGLLLAGSGAAIVGLARPRDVLVNAREAQAI